MSLAIDGDYVELLISWINSYFAEMKINLTFSLSSSFLKTGLSIVIPMALLFATSCQRAVDGLGNNISQTHQLGELSFIRLEEFTPEIIDRSQTNVDSSFESNKAKFNIVFGEKENIVYLTQEIETYDNKEQCQKAWSRGEEIFWAGFFSKMNQAHFDMFRDSSKFSFGHKSEFSQASINRKPFAKILHGRTNNLIVRYTYIDRNMDSERFDSLINLKLTQLSIYLKQDSVSIRRQ